MTSATDLCLTTAQRAASVPRSLTFVLSLCVLTVFGAMPGWSQISAVSEGPHRVPHGFPIVSPAEPAADLPAAKHQPALHYSFITIGPESSPYAVADGINDFGLVTGYYEDSNSISMVLFGATASLRRWTTPAPPIRFYTE